MTSKSGRRLKKITLRLNEDDLENLRQFYLHAGYNKIIRALVAQHVSRLNERLSEKLSDAALHNASVDL
jgi:hypothetical protein